MMASRFVSFGILATILGLSLVAGACSGIDCPLHGNVACNYRLIKDPYANPTSLTVTTRTVHGKDTTLFSHAAPVDSFALPMSYALPIDTLVFQFAEGTDTLWISKENHPHFESVDCGINYFHTITQVRHTRHAIDSVVIQQKEVTYDPLRKNISIYLQDYRP